jgi:hypothetical protein
MRDIDSREQPRVEWRLECVACRCASDPDAHGWRAYLGREKDGTMCVLTMCPECWGDELDVR